MTNHATGTARAILLVGVVLLASAAGARAQAGVEAGAIGAASAGTGALTSKATGKPVGSALGGLGAKLNAATAASPGTAAAGTGAAGAGAPPAASAGTTTVVLTRSGGADAGAAGIVTVEGTPPEIHFDVVSFQKCAGGVSSSKVDMPADGDFVSYHCQPVSQMISFAYAGGEASDLNLTGYPAWAATELFNLEAKVAAEDVATWQSLGVSARKIALRKLLADEMKLRVKVKTNSKPVYTLQVALSGPKLKEYTDGERERLPNGLTLSGKDMTWVGRVAYFQNTSMEGLVQSLSAHLDRPVVNQTGLIGGYNFSLPLPHGSGTSANADLADSVPSVAESLAAFGLRLESGKGEVDALVVDRLELPPMN